MKPSITRLIHDEWQDLKRCHPGRSWIALHFGEPDLGTPDFIVEAGCRALRQGAVFYEDNSGRADLKRELVEHHRRHDHAHLVPENFVITCGGTQAIMLTMLAVLSPGDDVINVTPAWPNFTEAARIAGATVHELPLTFVPEQGTFELDFAELESTFRRCLQPRLIIVNSPSNPTGWIMSESQKCQLYDFCREHDVLLLADEIYDRIVFVDHPSSSFLTLDEGSDRLIIINGFSKVYAMTGWRVGYLIAPADLAAKMARMQEFLTSHAPSMAQVAAITALREGESYVAASVHRYRRLRRVALNQLGSIPGSTVARPDGSIYVFFRLPGSDDSLAFCRDLLAQSGVVLAPGRAFGRGGESWLRLCIANEEAVLCQAIDRIGGFLTQQGHKS